ncbi:MAG: hypothetical protein ACAI35_27855 [Candidatus Methylacidiphilales bacterium]|nr:hypothetical protein [Candidatus Methylacidiphilales bacterium]
MEGRDAFTVSVVPIYTWLRYDSASHLTRAVKQSTGQTPGALRPGKEA